MNLDKTLGCNDAITLYSAQLQESVGIVDPVIAIQLFFGHLQATQPAQTTAEQRVDLLNGIAYAIQSMRPHDEFEAQLISQLLVLHEHSMEYLGRAMRAERVDFANVYVNAASKLLARHHETLESLLKYRRKGEQRVHVEHVHVHDGGQAIVGNVLGGGGVNHKAEGGPHAKV